MIKKRWQRNLIRIASAFFLFLLVIGIMGYFLPLPESIVKPMIIKEFRNATSGYEIDVEEVRVILIRNRASLRDVCITEPISGDTYDIELLTFKLKYFPLRIAKMQVLNPARVSMSLPEEPDGSILFDNNVFQRLLTKPSPGGTGEEEFSLNVTGGEIEVRVPLEKDKPPRSLVLEKMNVHADYEHNFFMLRGYAGARIFGHEPQAISLTLNIKRSPLVVEFDTKCPALTIPLELPSYPAMNVRLNDPAIGITYTHVDEDSARLGVTCDAVDAGLFSFDGTTLYNSVTNPHLDSRMEFNTQNPDKITLDPFNYYDDTMSLRLRGLVDSSLPGGAFDMNYEVTCSNYDLLQKIRSRLELPHTIDLALSKNTTFNSRGTCTGTLEPLTVSEYEYTGSAAHVAVVVPEITTAHVTSATFGGDTDSFHLQSSELQGEFGTLFLEGSVKKNAVPDHRKSPYLAIALKSRGAARFDSTMSINFDEKELPFIADVDVQTVSPRMLDFVLTRTDVIPKRFTVSTTPDSCVCGSARVRGWLEPFCVGYISGTADPSGIAIAIEENGTWIMEKADVSFSPDVVSIKKLHVRGTPGEIGMYGTFKKGNLSNRWQGDFVTSSTLHVPEITDMAAQFVPTESPFVKSLLGYRMQGDVSASVQGTCAFTMASDFELIEPRFSGDVQVNNFKFHPSRNAPPCVISAGASVSNDRLILEEFFTQYDGTRSNISGTIEGEEFFWQRPVWNLYVVGETSLSRLISTLPGVPGDLSLDGNSVCEYELSLQRWEEADSTITDQVRMLADASKITVADSKRSVDIKNIVADVEFRDTAFTIHSLAGSIDARPFEIRGTLLPDTLDATLDSEIDLATLKETFYEYIPFMILEGSTTATLHLTHSLPTTSTLPSNNTPLPYYRAIGKRYADVLDSAWKRMRHLSRYPGFIEGCAYFDGATISYWEFPVVINNIRGTVFINGNKLGTRGIKCDIGKTRKAVIDGTVDFSGEYPEISLEASVPTLYLSEWSTGWNPLTEELQPIFVKQQAGKNVSEKSVLHLVIHATGDKLILEPLNSDEFDFNLEYYCYPGDKTNIVKFSGSRAKAYGGVMSLKEGEIQIIKHRQPTEHSWNIAVNDVSVKELYDDVHTNGSEMYGTLSSRIMVSARGEDLSTIEGSGSFHIDESKFIRIPLYDLLEERMNFPSALSPSTYTVDSEFTVKDSHITFDPLKVESIIARLAASGTVDFEENIDFQIYLAYASSIFENVPLVGAFGSKLFKKFEELGALVAKLRLTGTLSDPEYTVIPFSMDEIYSRFKSFTGM